jgi:hypothetical protein
MAPRNNFISNDNSRSIHNDKKTILCTYRTVAIITIVAFALLFFSLALQASNAQKVQQGTNCGCILDYTTGGYLFNNITGITMPKVKLIKNETLESQTEGHLTWKAVRSTQLMGILTDGFFLGNFSSGTGATVALNTLIVKPNESLGIQLAGGTLPKSIKGEIVTADVDPNGTLGEVKANGKKKIELPIQYEKSKKPASNKNRIILTINDKPSDYLLLIALTYDNVANDNISFATKKGQTIKQLVAIYDTVLKVK